MKVQLSRSPRTSPRRLKRHQKFKESRKALKPHEKYSSVTKTFCFRLLVTGFKFFLPFILSIPISVRISHIVSAVLTYVPVLISDRPWPMQTTHKLWQKQNLLWLWKLASLRDSLLPCPALPQHTTWVAVFCWKGCEADYSASLKSVSFAVQHRLTLFQTPDNVISALNILHSLGGGLSGSIIVQTLLNETYPDSDLDIYLDTQEAFFSFLSFLSDLGLSWVIGSIVE